MVFMVSVVLVVSSVKKRTTPFQNDPFSALEFPNAVALNAVALNAVGRRNMQMSAKEHK